MNKPMDAQYEDRWETFSSVFVRFYDLERKDIIRDNSNTCVKDKVLKRSMYYSIYGGSFLTWSKFLGVENDE